MFFLFQTEPFARTDLARVVRAPREATRARAAGVARIALFFFLISKVAPIFFMVIKNFANDVFTV